MPGKHFYSQLLLVCFCLLPFAGNGKTGQPKPAGYSSKLQQATLLFAENRGQVTGKNGARRKDVLFTAHNGSTSLYLTATAIHYQFTKITNTGGYDPAGLTDPEKQDRQTKKETYHFSVSLAGANPNPHIRREGKSTFTQNYYLSSCPSGITGVAAYGKLVYEEVYPHIDWVIYSKGGRIKYDFIVKEGGDAAQIKLKVADAEQVGITGDGELLMATRLGEVKEKKPVSYAAGKEVNTRFKQNSDGTIGFEVAPHPGGQLRIDPSVEWATYFGGSGAETSYSCNLDSAGHIYISGTTTSTASVTTANGYDTSYNTGGYAANAFLAKFDTAGTILWATYYGDSITNTVSCAVDDSGNVFLACSTIGSGLATAGSFQASFSGPGSTTTPDGLLIKFTPAGSRLWATYYGVNLNAESVAGCTTDHKGNVYIAGTTTATATASSYFSTTGGQSAGLADAYLAKFSPTGARLWATLYGGSASEQMSIHPCSVDPWNNVYLVVITFSNSSSLVTTGAFKTGLTGSTDALLIKFDSSGNRKWATYFGGSALESASGGCVADNIGNVYLAGTTTSPTGSGIGTVNQTTYGGGNSDGYLARFDTGGTFKWSTYYGGSLVDQVTTPAIDPATQKVYIIGITTSTSGIATPNGYKTNASGGNDGFIAKFDSSGTLNSGTYFGRSGSDILYSCAISKTGYIYFTGSTTSDTLATTGAYHTTRSGTDGLLVKMNLVDAPTITTGAITGSPFCAGATVSVPFTMTGAFNSGNIFTAQLSNATGSFAGAVNIGTLTATTAGTITATIPANTAGGTGYRIRVIGSSPADTGTDNGLNMTINAVVAPSVTTAANPAGAICQGASVTFTATAVNGGGAPTYQWNKNGNPLTGETNVTYTTTTLNNNDIITVTLTSNATCATPATATSTGITAAVKPLPAQPSAFTASSAVVCQGQSSVTYTVPNDPAVTYNWSYSGTGATINGTSNSVTVDFSNTATGGTLSVTGTATNGCGISTARTLVVTVNPIPHSGNITGPSSMCAGTTITLADTAIGGTWSSSNAFATVTGGIVSGLSAGLDTIIYAVTNSCGTSIATKTITINPQPNEGIINGPTTVCAGYSITLTNAANGGIWSSSNNAIATVSGGVVTGVSAGNVTITYTVANSCGSATASKSITVKASPIAGSITGASQICAGVSITLTDTASGGTWSSSDNSVATVAGGIVKGISGGTAIISYTVTNDCSTAIATTVITVNALPTAPAITTQGPSTTCTGVMYQNYGTTTPPPSSVIYTWTATNALVWAQGAAHQYALVNFNAPGNATITITATNTVTACNNSSHVTVAVGSNIAPTSSVSYFNNHFVCTANNENSYQWGYDDAYTLDSTLLTGEINQDYVNTKPDFTTKFYWVINTLGGCLQKTYYRVPATVQGVNNNIGISVYPNPASSIINISIEDAIQSGLQVELSTILGQKLSFVSAFDNKATIDIAALPAGPYILTCYKNGIRMAVARFIKN